ncbi:hypothetical protein MAHJHV57_49690 [Mycobacterium avium subsp. hominissuis]
MLDGLDRHQRRPARVAQDHNHPRRPSLVPVEAVEHLTGEVQYTEEMPIAVPWSLPARGMGTCTVDVVAR